ncbi:MAG: hypothetical protein MUF47_07630 [Porphyrobacter sp.]|jgi:hypothetical protein|nr:hypothetical protein [Porphyrobacter sp.]
MQHSFAAGLARLRANFLIYLKEYMNFITTRAMFDRPVSLSANKPHTPTPELTSPPYAFLSAHDLRGLVAAMVD